MIKKCIVPETAVPKTLSGDKTVKTIAGQMNANQMVHLRDVRLPEFDKNRKISMQKALIFDGPCKYDIIFGADFLTKIGMDISYRRGEVEWYGNTIMMREPSWLSNHKFLHMCDSFFIQEEEDIL